jgi:glutamate--cysteine ligase
LSTDAATELYSESVESVDQLVVYFEAAGKPKERWRVGTEHEMIGVRLADPAGAPIQHGGPGGIESVLAALAARGWTGVHDGEALIGLHKDGSGISIEPGGQFEHASAPVAAGDGFCAELRAFRDELAEVSAERDLAWLSVGFRPFGTLDDVPWMPKRRYKIMREYLGRRGSLAHEMMKRTATVQVNLDYSDSADAAAKLRCAFSITSLLTALYANSPVVDGAITEYQSYRSHIWHHTDDDRCGLLPFAFDDGCIFRRYAEWAMQVPVLFIMRDGEYVPGDGTRFGAFVDAGYRGHRATMADWTMHLSTLFPEVRLKTYIEIRGCDAGSHGVIAGLGPLAAGILYDADARDAATALTAGLDFAERLELSREVARTGMNARMPSGVPIIDRVRELIDIAEAGLRAHNPADLHFIEPLRALATSGRSQADHMIDVWRSETEIAPRIRALAYPTLGGA